MNTFLVESPYDTINKQIKERGLEKFRHTRISADKYLEGMLDYMFFKENTTEYKNEKLDEILKELDKYELITPEDFVFYRANSKEDKGILTNTKLGQTGEDISIKIKENGSVFYVWDVFTINLNYGGNNSWTILSFKEEDKKYAEKFLSLLQAFHSILYKITKTIKVWGGTDFTITEQNRVAWKNYVLTDHIEKALKDDVEFFLGNEKHYNEKKLPYKRGYLLTGPAGNGKSSVARVLLSMYNFSGYVFNFGETDLKNSDLLEAFDSARKNTPALFLMEDIDRLFDEKAKTNITLECLLNCLDGINVNSGVVVMATANNPEKLDPAIRRRPGRFDAVVLFDNPTEEYRLKYLQKMFSDSTVSQETMQKVAANTDGFSMAFMKMVYETSAVISLQRKSIDKKFVINNEDLLAGLVQTRSYYTESETVSERKTGFRG